MSVRFLLFSGSWENEGNFYLLETEKSIVVIAAGKGYSLVDFQEQQIGLDYLKESRHKVKAVVINNTSFQNIGLLENICQILGNNVPLYTSFHNKLIISYFFPRFRNKVLSVEKDREVKIDDFLLSFFPLNSYLIGNLALNASCFQYSFYFLEAFVFSSILNNNFLFSPSFLPDFQQFLRNKKRDSFLITSCQGLHWQNKNSLFFATSNFPQQSGPLFFLFYDFDWLHIFELLTIVRSCLLNEECFVLMDKILFRNPLNEVIEKGSKTKENDIYLLVGNPKSIRKNLDHYLSFFSAEKKSSFHFVVGIPPVIGGEEQLARLIDYLYTQSELITNLSKKEYLSLGASFYDFKLLIQLLKPTGVIALQNSYKNENFFANLPGNFLPVGDGYSLDFSTRKTSRLKIKKTLISLEELLLKQRENLGQSGLLIILLTVEWKENKLQLKKVGFENLAVSLFLNISKLEHKIKNWWESKLVPDIKITDPTKIVKKAVERRLSGLVKSYLSLEYEVELEEVLILLFNR
jgi:mRNA degradation ribonuclease J1/J2